MAGGLPYVEVPNPDTLPAQPYAVLLLVGVALGALTAVWLGRRRGLSGEALGVLLPSAIAAAFVGGHLFDVAWYFPDGTRPGGCGSSMGTRSSARCSPRR